MFAKKKSIKNKELFEGDSIYTSRVIKRAVKYINSKIIEQKSKKEKVNLINIIKVVIDKFYVRPYIGKGIISDGQKSIQLEYREKIIENFSKQIDKYSRIYSDNNFDDNRKLLEQLRDIQIAVTEKKKDFKFNEFVSNSLNIKLEAIEYILEHIDSTLGFIEFNQSKLSNEHINNYSQISIIYKLLKYEIGSMNSASTDEFLHESTFLGKFIVSFMKRPELNNFLSILLNPMINSIENKSQEDCLNMSLFAIQNFIRKDLINKHESINLYDIKIDEDKFWFNTIPKTSIHFKKNLQIEAEKAEENRKIIYSME
jgi:hypothetical protein